MGVWVCVKFIRHDGVFASALAPNLNQINIGASNKLVSITMAIDQYTVTIHNQQSTTGTRKIKSTVAREQGRVLLLHPDFMFFWVAGSRQHDLLAAPLLCSRSPPSCPQDQTQQIPGKILLDNIVLCDDRARKSGSL